MEFNLPEFFVSVIETRAWESGAPVVELTTVPAILNVWPASELSCGAGLVFCDASTRPGGNNAKTEIAIISPHVRATKVIANRSPGSFLAASAPSEQR